MRIGPNLFSGIVHYVSRLYLSEKLVLQMGPKVRPNGPNSLRETRKFHQLPIFLSSSYLVFFSFVILCEKLVSRMGPKIRSNWRKLVSRNLQIALLAYFCLVVFLILFCCFFYLM